MRPTVSISSTPDRSIAAIAPETPCNARSSGPIAASVSVPDSSSRVVPPHRPPPANIARHHPSRVSYGEIFACRQGSRVGQRARASCSLHRSMAAGMARAIMPNTDATTLAHHFSTPPTSRRAGTTTGKPMACFRPERPDADAFNHRQPAAQRHRLAAYRPCASTTPCRTWWSVMNGLRGKDALWVVGTDQCGHRHADGGRTPVGGDRRQAQPNYSREDFVAKVWAWKEEKRRHHHPPAAPPRLLDGLEPRTVSPWTRISPAR